MGTDGIGVFVIDQQFDDEFRMQLRRKSLIGFYEERQGFIGAAVLTAQNMRVKLCIFSAAQVDVFAERNDYRPVLGYYKQKCENGNWTDIGYKSVSNGIDWNDDTWKDLLLQDMKKALNED